MIHQIIVLPPGRLLTQKNQLPEADRTYSPQQTDHERDQDHVDMLGTTHIGVSLTQRRSDLMDRQLAHISAIEKTSVTS